jgi:hypothetical protein
VKGQELSMFTEYQYAERAIYSLQEHLDNMADKDWKVFTIQFSHEATLAHILWVRENKKHPKDK